MYFFIHPWTKQIICSVLLALTSRKDIPSFLFTKVKCRGSVPAEAHLQPRCPQHRSPLPHISAPSPKLLLLLLCRQVAKLLQQAGPFSHRCWPCRSEVSHCSRKSLCRFGETEGWTACPRALCWMQRRLPRCLTPKRSSHPTVPLVSEGGHINCFTGKHQLVRKLKAVGFSLTRLWEPTLKEQIENRSRKRMGTPDWGDTLVLCVNSNPSGSWQPENSTREG